MMHMKKRTLYVGMFLLAVSLFIGMTAVNAQAGISVDDATRTITLTTGHYDIHDINITIDDNDKFCNQSNGVWLSNYSINVSFDAVLEISPNATVIERGCRWLKLNNYTNVTWCAHINVTDSGGGTNGGVLWVNDTMITGWNHTIGANTSYVDLTYIRPWIYVQGGHANNNTKAYFLNSTLGYLGYNQSERYGIVYRDSNTSGSGTYHYPQGWIHNCTVLENYIGIAFQGVPNMNVTDSYFNDSKEVGIVYTVGTNFSGVYHSADYGYVGDVKNLTNASAMWDGEYDGVTVVHINGTTDPDGCDGIRLYAVDNVTFDDVEIINCTNMGLRATLCAYLHMNNTLSYNNTNAASDYNIYLINVTNSTFTNCTAHSPNGTTDGGNWYFGSSDYNNLSNCRAWGSVSYIDFYIWTSSHNNLIDCTANDSDIGFYITHGNNNTCHNCRADDHVHYNYKIKDGQYNIIDEGYANNSMVGVLIYDEDNTHVSYNNTIVNLTINTATSYAISIGTDGGGDNWCHNNTVRSATVVGTTNGDGIFLFDNVTDNIVADSTVTGCSHVNADGMGFANDSYGNTFLRCNSSSNGDAGFSIIGNANNNTIDNCTGYGDGSTGLEIEGDNSMNNTILYCTFWNNRFGVLIWPNAASTCVNNSFVNCEIHNNTDTGVDYGRAPMNYFLYCAIVDNDDSGVEVRTSGNISFYKCVVWNPSATLYDWIFENTTTVEVFGDHILGYNKNCNNQTSDSPYGNVSHAPGDGAWNLDTTRMTVYPSAATDYCVINMVSWTSTTYRRWVGTSTSCTNLYQIIGGLSIGTKYDLLVDSSVLATVTAFSGTILPGEGATGYVWFNYSGTWSTHTFEIKRYEAPGPGPGPGPGPAADENDIYVYVLTNGEDPIVNATVYIYENSVIVKTGTTDTDGLYDTTLDDGTFKFVANADGYREEYQQKAITGDTTVVFHLTPTGYLPAWLAGPYLNLSVFGWIIAAALVFIGFLLAYLIDSKQIKKDYLLLILIPNAVLVILGIIGHPLLVILGVACAIIQFLWAGRVEL